MERWIQVQDNHIVVPEEKMEYYQDVSEPFSGI